jgi:hypothetical protein
LRGEKTPGWKRRSRIDSSKAFLLAGLWEYPGKKTGEGEVGLQDTTVKFGRDHEFKSPGPYPNPIPSHQQKNNTQQKELKQCSTSYQQKHQQPPSLPPPLDPIKASA